MNTLRKFQPEELVTRSPEETIAFARRFSKKLRAGDVLAFRGDLGSGKTTFIKGIAEGLGLKNRDDVKSPTFVIMHTYEARLSVYHFDLYRFEASAELEQVGFDEFLKDPHAVTCVEWAERADSAIPESAYWISMTHDGQSNRKIRIVKGKTALPAEGKLK